MITDLGDDEESINIFNEIWMEILMKYMSLGCFSCCTGEMVGVTLLYIQNKNNHNGLTPKVKYEFQHTSLSSIINDDKSIYRNSFCIYLQNFTGKLAEVQRIMSKIETINIFDKYKVDNYLAGSIYVKPRYRKFYGIETQLLKIREQVCVKHKLNVTSSIFIMDYENRAANAAGFRVNCGMR